MIRKQVNLLVLSDDDMECRRENMPIEELGLVDTSFTLKDLEPFDIIVYQGRRGTKLLRSRNFKSGIIH